MEQTTFLGQYRICLNSDGAPHELSRTGSAVTYEAIDERSEDTVALTLIPTASIDPATQAQFEEQARAAQRLRHINIAKTFDLGQEEGNFAYVSEYLPGETLASWVAAHGPMPADAVLRVAAQVVSALSATSFHKFPHRAIQPSNLMMVAGPTPEGGWPFVKLMNFGLAGLKFNGPGGGEDREEGFSVKPQFASPEQLQQQPVDFQSEIYSLGATMYFLLTGAAPSAELRSRQLRVFPKPLRSLLSQMLHHNPDDRPKDPAALTEMIRECLMKIERRQALAHRFGIPFMTSIPRVAERPRGRLLRRALAFGALLLAAAAVAAVLLPEPIGRILHPDHGRKEIGVLVGVPETSPPPAVQYTPTATVPAVVANQPPANPSPPLANLNQASSPDLQQAQTSNAQLVAGAIPANTPAANSSAPSAAPENPAQAQDNSSAQANVAPPQPATAGRPSSRTKKKKIASTSRRARIARVPPNEWPPFPGSSLRPRVVGTTPDGRAILRLPSGRVVILAPRYDGEDEFLPPGRRRAFMERGEIFPPPPLFPPDYFPYD
jgi:serine/threonine protein kinase